jgi:predicted permease
VTAAVVIVIALAGLVMAALLFAREPAAAARVAALAGTGLGFVVALGIALLTGKSGSEAFAIALMGAAVLPLVLLAQMRVVRSLMHRR